MELEVLYQDESLVAVNKPSGLLVHPTGIATDRTTCMSLLRDQLGRFVYPLHRLDRGTSGVLMMALDDDAARLMNLAFRERRVHKTYLAIVRGWLPDEGIFERPLRRKNGEREEAITRYRTLGRATVDHPVGPYPEARYSLVSASPVTGRWHQIRRHLSNGNHPVVGDTVHGDGRHNRLFRQLFDSHRLLLHAFRIEFDHPLGGGAQSVSAPIPDDFRRVCRALGL